MKLLDERDLVKAIHLNKIGGIAIAKLLMQLLKFNKINRAYESISDKQGMDFIDGVIDYLGLRFDIKEAELERIPKDGPFITVSNHPFGGIDGVLLIKLLCEQRPDYRVLANFLLYRVEQLQPFLFPVNPFENRKNIHSSVKGMRNALLHLKNGSSLGIFPAGEVSSYHIDNKRISDREWLTPALKFMKRAQVPVVPVYFQGTNSKLFYLLGQIHPLLRTARLPSELFNKKNKTIKIRIGNPISVKDQDEFTSISQYGRFLRAKTYSLGTSLPVDNFFKPKKKLVKHAEPVAPPTPQEQLKEEIAFLNENDFLLFTNHDFHVYCAPANDIPNMLNELGRLREITFREVGEGTNKSIDLDEYDIYYHHLIIWDSINHRVVGAYRVGKGKDIIAQYGTKGFYIKSLFKISKKFTPILRQSLELGRSFIIKEYQRKPLSLFLLWKGILYFLLKNPEYRYLVGPVSISNEFSKFSKGLIVDFIKYNYFDQQLARYIKPRNKFKLAKKYKTEKDILLNSANQDLKRLDKYIRDIQPSLAIPILLKKYLQLNAKIIGFNIDPDFNDCLDGLIILDLYDVPMNTLEAFSKEIDDTTILERFQNHII